MKIAPRSLAWLGLTASLSLLAADGPGAAPASRKNLFVGFKERPTPAQERLLESHGARIRSVFANVKAIAIDLDEARIGDVARAQGVDYVEEDPMRYKLGLGDAQLVPSLANGLYGLLTTKATAAHVAGITGTTVKVGVADTSLDYTHPDIAGNYASGTDTVGAGDDDPINDDGETHGTHVAGTILAVNNSVGVRGVAYGAKLYHARVLGPNGGTTTDIMEGVRWLAVTQGCHIVNLSLGGGLSSRTEENFYKDMRATYGALVVAATGNDGRTRLSFPAAYAVNIAVGAVDVNNALASFSNTGKNIDVVAPGVGILSSVPIGTGSEAGVTVGLTSYRAFGMEFAARTTPDYTATLVNCGRGQLTDFTNAAPAGFVALIERGDIDFATKAANAKTQGAGAVIIYNNVAGDFIGTLGAAGSWLPTVSVSQATGTALKGTLGSPATVLNLVSNWDHYDGTSMATPHTAGVLALILEARKLTVRNKANADAAENFLKSSCLNLGPAGYDTTFGSGLVQAPTVRLP